MTGPTRPFAQLPPGSPRPPDFFAAVQYYTMPRFRISATRTAFIFKNENEELKLIVEATACSWQIVSWGAVSCRADTLPPLLLPGYIGKNHWHSPRCASDQVPQTGRADRCRIDAWSAPFWALPGRIVCSLCSLGILPCGFACVVHLGAMRQIIWQGFSWQNFR